MSLMLSAGFFQKRVEALQEPLSTLMQDGQPGDEHMVNRLDRSTRLAYRLRKSVHLTKRKDAPVVVLDYPLKAAILDRFWAPAFEYMSEGSFFPLDRINSFLNTEDSNKVRLFLDDLVRKGFLEREGVEELSEFRTVSVIIPVRNRPEEIRECLGSLEKLDYPTDKLEIIVVDDASTDHTPDVVREFPVQLICLQGHMQASHCRNLAAQKAYGDILAFIDSDCLAGPLWLRELLPSFWDSSLGALGGMVDSEFSEKPLDHYEKVKSSLNMGKGFKRTRKSDCFFYVPSCNLLVKRDVFFTLGGFNENLAVGEDVDFCWRMQSAGFNLEYQPIGKVYHRHRNRLKDFCLRRFDYGSSEPLLHKLHPQIEKELYFPPAKTIFWATVCLAFTLDRFYLLLAGLFVFLVDSSNRLFKSRRSGVNFGLSVLLQSIVREYATFFYHNCAFISRYYLFLTILALPVSRLVSLSCLCAHLLTTIVEFRVYRPKLNPISFLFFFTLEQLFYQLGVWGGCLKHRTFNPVIPAFVFRKPKCVE